MGQICNVCKNSDLKNEMKFPVSNNLIKYRMKN